MGDWADELKVEVPDEVRICGDRLDGAHLWWRAVTNHEQEEARSCRQAVKIRDRLGSGGNGGIPLWAELKSLVGVAKDTASGKEIPFAAHTRGNTRFNERLLLNALGLSTSAQLQLFFDDDSAGILPESGSGNHSKMSGEKWFGRVNPFNVDRILSEFTGRQILLKDVPQVLDESIGLDGGVPNTLMSNLGSRTIAFELHPNDLISAVGRLSPQSSVGLIAEPCPVWLGLAGEYRKDYWLQFPPATGPKMGILTGNSPESGMTLWRDMLGAMRSFYPNLPDTLKPEVHVRSVPAMALSMELIAREKEVEAVVWTGVAELIGAGCTIITFACNTTIYYEPTVSDHCAQMGARFVSIAEACMPEVRRALAQAGADSVGLVGIGPVVDMAGAFSGYKRHLEGVGVRVIPCPADALAHSVKTKGTGDQLITEFRRLMTKGLPPENMVVVLALTEASMIYREHAAKAPKKSTSGKVFIDPLLQLGRYLSYLYIVDGYRESRVCQIPADLDVEGRVSDRFGWS